MALAIKENIKRLAQRVPGVMNAYRKVQDARRWRAISQSERTAWTLDQVRTLSTAIAGKNLRFFLDSNTSWAFPSSPTPAVSVIIPVFNRADLTLQCLEALSSEAAVGVEVIIIDNASSDETADVFERIKGLRYVRNHENAHFLEASNQGAALARGDSLLFLNSDTRVLPGSLSAALDTLTSDPINGAVGARLIFPDGSLQEAGSMIWRDGTCLGYGRGDHADRAPYQFRRPVDYCSGAFLLTPRALFEKLGGFDREFRPAYYEEVDYCLRLWERGYQVIYEPAATVWHFEFASSQEREDALRLQRERQALIVRKHAALISRKPIAAPPHVLLNRSAKQSRRRVLWIDERIPHSHYGAGYPRAREIVKCLDESDCAVTLYPAVFEEAGETWDKIYQALPRSVEVAALPGYGPRGLQRFLQHRKGYYDLYFVSRPVTMRAIRALLKHDSTLIPLSHVVYDAEALFSNRERLEAGLAGKAMTEIEYGNRVERELSLARGVRRIMTVSAQEATVFRTHGFNDISIVTHAVAVNPPVKTFRERSGILFVGAIHGNGGPNYDAAQWFCGQILPLLRAQGIPDTFYIVGYNAANGPDQYRHLGVEIIGAVSDLRQWYERSRVFVAPTRFSAGIPLKVVEALANGLPAVVTPLLVDQLGWSSHPPVLCAGTAEDFARAVNDLLTDEPLWSRLSHASLGRIAGEFSRARMREELGKVIGMT